MPSRAAACTRRSYGRPAKGIVMPPECVLILCLLSVLPIGWLISEFSQLRALRITLGLASIILACVASYTLASILERFNYNAWYGFASKDLIHSIVEKTEAGEIDQILDVLKKLDKDFYPTYENRAHYDELVDQAVKEMKSTDQVPLGSAGSDQ
jgi:hypothetical protein